MAVLSVEASNRLADLLDEQIKRTLPIGSGEMATALTKASLVRKGWPGAGLLMDVLFELPSAPPRGGDCTELLVDCDTEDEEDAYDIWEARSDY
jgi:hypothetical protein